MVYENRDTINILFVDALWEYLGSLFSLEMSRRALHKLRMIRQQIKAELVTRMAWITEIVLEIIIAEEGGLSFEEIGRRLAHGDEIEDEMAIRELQEILDSLVQCEFIRSENNIVIA